MRVLAIRGSNLASLEGEFEVDFEAEPLASAGIFAITGPTGAGKSTLLDAMCLALFNSLPRLAGAGAGQVGAEDGASISATDPRAALRHRCGEGHAEIDFVGRDRVRYRARWAARRARGKADGTLQQASVQLCELDTGQRIGGNNTETLQEIGHRIGLTHAQFARAVLLAQGDFDAFVRANPNDRAALLEKLTGTEIYARLGMAARRRADRLRGEVSALEQRIADLRGLDDEARAAVEERRSEAASALAAAEARLTRLRDDRRWHATAVELAMLADQAAGLVEAAEAVRLEAAPRRENLRRRVAAAALVPQWRLVADAQSRAARGIAAVGDLRRAGETSDAEAHRLEQQAVAAREACTSAETIIEDRRPELERARALDREIAEARERLEPLRTEVERHRVALATAEADWHAADAAHAQADRNRHDLATWLSDHETRRGLADREAMLTADLVERQVLADNVVVRRTALAEAQHALDLASEARAAAQSTLAEAVEAHAAALERVAEAQALAPGAGVVESAVLARNAVAAVEPRIEALARRSEALALKEAALARLRTDLGRERDLSAECRDRLEQLSHVVPELRGRLAEARRSSDLSSAAADEASSRLRETLIPGKPCPVCGSCEHRPELVADLALRRATEDEARKIELEDELLSAEREVAGLEERRGTADANVVSLEAREVETVDELANASSDHRKAEAALAEAARVAGIATDSDLATMREDVVTRLAAADAARDASEAAARRLEGERTAAEELRQARESAEAAGGVAERAELAAREDATSLERSLDEAVSRLDWVERGLDEELGTHFAWRDESDAGGRLAQLVTEWRTRHDRHGAIVEELPALAAAVHAADLRRAGARSSASGAEQELAAGEERVTELSGRRDGMLDGIDTEELATRLENAVAIARGDLEAARTSAGAARNLHAATAAQLSAAQTTLAEDERDAERLEGELEVLLGRAGLEAEAVLAEAEAPEGDLENEREAFQEIDAAAERAATQLATRREDAARHASTPRPELNAGDVEIATGEVDAAVVKARGLEAEAGLALRQDDTVREASARLRAELATLREGAAVWLELDQLIGDATGSRFRRFAQGLTLDRLLAHANARLLELRPRYELQRGLGGDMLIQVVDHDLAGEVRGLHNLSGGERFLVSLALALGLSEMSSGEGLRIESLFIDEGFGALDSASLGSAIAMLEQLHAAGRRVGVISHIEEVKERIPIKVAVTPVSRGRSRVEVVST